MSAVLRVALFRADDQEFHLLSTALARREHTLELVHNPTELIERVNSQSLDLDAIAVPMRLKSTSGMSVCLTLKANPAFATVPIIALVPRKDIAIIQSFYGAGADAVLVAPFDPEALHLQIAALARRTQIFREQMLAREDGLGLRGLALRALDLATEGLLIFDGYEALHFANTTAARLFGVSNGQLEVIEASCGPLKDLVRPLLTLTRIDNSAPSFPEAQRVTITRADGLVRDLIIRIEMIGSAGQMWIAASLTDETEILYLSRAFIQAQRTRSLALLSTSGALHLMQEKLGQIPLKPLHKLQSLLDSERTYASLNQVARTLLEFVDSIITISTDVRVSFTSDPLVALRSSDLFQLLGHVILYAIERAGSEGETTISSDLEEGGREVCVMINAENSKRTGLTTGRISEMILSETWGGASSETGKLLSGIGAAQQIADRYQISIEYKDQPSALKIRVRLPVQNADVISTSEWRPPAPKR